MAHLMAFGMEDNGMDLAESVGAGMASEARSAEQAGSRWIEGEHGRSQQGEHLARPVPDQREEIARGVLRCGD